MNSTDIIIGLFLIFGLIVYMICVPPLADNLVEYMVPSGEFGVGAQQFAHKAAVFYIPVIYGFGILVWGFAAATRREGYYGYR